MYIYLLPISFTELLYVMWLRDIGKMPSLSISPICLVLLHNNNNNNITIVNFQVVTIIFTNVKFGLYWHLFEKYNFDKLVVIKLKSQNTTNFETIKRSLCPTRIRCINLCYFLQ